jgi:hypothetical protein
MNPERASFPWDFPLHSNHKIREIDDVKQKIVPQTNTRSRELATIMLPSIPIDILAAYNLCNMVSINA